MELSRATHPSRTRPETEGLRPVRHVAESALSLLVHLAHRPLRLGRRYRANERHVSSPLAVNVRGRF